MKQSGVSQAEQHEKQLEREVGMAAHMQWIVEEEQGPCYRRYSEGPVEPGQGVVGEPLQGRRGAHAHEPQVKQADAAEEGRHRQYVRSAKEVVERLQRKMQRPIVHGHEDIGWDA